MTGNMAQRDGDLNTLINLCRSLKVTEMYISAYVSENSGMNICICWYHIEITEIEENGASCYFFYVQHFGVEVIFVGLKHL